MQGGLFGVNFLSRLSMKEKINIIQFMPYFPPHKWWLETVWEEIWKHWVSNELWFFINIVTDFEQWTMFNRYENIVYAWEKIWYFKDWYEVLVIPSFEIINNFPVYKIWSSEYKLVKKYLAEKIGENNGDFRVFTHTRFFLTSFIWWLFARKNNIKWIHIEHGSDYVKLSSKIKSYISILYDKSFWKWVFKKADTVLAISEACRKFIKKEFVNRKVDVFYRWLKVTKTSVNKSWEIKLLFVWRLVKLKWVENLIQAFKRSGLTNELIIIWDWDEKIELEKISKWLNIQFMWFRESKFIFEYLSQNNCILVNPSYQEWLPTTVIEAIITWNIVVGSNVWGTPEISNKEDLVLYEAWNTEILMQKLLYWVYNYEKLSWLSRKWVREKFDWNTNILKLYNFVK